MYLYSCVLALLTEAAELTNDVGQGDVGHALQLVPDVPWQYGVAQVPGLNGALHQRHPFAKTTLPRVRQDGGRIKASLVLTCYL